MFVYYYQAILLLHDMSPIKYKWCNSKKHNIKIFIINKSKVNKYTPNYQQINFQLNTNIRTKFPIRVTHKCSSSDVLEGTQSPGKKAWNAGFSPRTWLGSRCPRVCYIPNALSPLLSPGSPGTGSLPSGTAPAFPAGLMECGRGDSRDTRCPGSRSGSPGWSSLCHLLAWEKREWGEKRGERDRER